MINYPPSPENVPANYTHISAAYKKEVWRSVFSILLFFFVFLLLIVLPIVEICCLPKLARVISPGAAFIVTIVALSILGIQIFFLFAGKKERDKSQIILNRKNQPELFEFIDRLCEEVGAKTPKKIILSEQNNARVFQDTGFWRLIIPPKKNLEIGIILISSIDISEFKAVLAHEFGHFSQSSTRLGTYIYSANTIIGKVIFSREFWEGSFWQIGRVHIFLYVFVLAIFEFSKMQRRLFALLYTFINKNYMRLSREMEFHADAVAASVSGSEPIINALKRMTYADYCLSGFDQFISRYVAEEKKLPDNYFNLYPEYARLYADVNRIGLTENGLVNLRDAELRKYFPQRKLNYSNLWESHPSLEDREKQTTKIYLAHQEVAVPAASLFRDWDSITLKMSNIIRASQKKKMKEMPPLVPYMDCIASMKKMMEKNKVPDRFINLYDYRIISKMEYFDLLGKTYEGPQSYELLVGKEEKEIAENLKLLRIDMAEIQAIRNKQLDVRVFEYDHVKYSWNKADELIETLEEQFKNGLDWLKKKDVDVFLFHLAIARNKKLSEEQTLVAAAKVHETLYNCDEELEKVGQIMLPVIRELQQRNFTRNEFSRFYPVFNNAADALTDLKIRINRMEVPLAIGDQKLDDGILIYLWQTKMEDYKKTAFSFELFMSIWEKLHLASGKILKLQHENHQYIIGLYEKIYAA